MFSTNLDRSRTGNKGFYIKFKNGNSISVQFGRQHYCSNNYLYNEDDDLNHKEVGDRIPHHWDCEDAEVYISIDNFEQESFIDDPLSMVTPEDAAKYMWALSLYTGEECLKEVTKIFEKANSSAEEEIEFLTEHIKEKDLKIMELERELFILRRSL